MKIEHILAVPRTSELLHLFLEVFTVFPWIKVHSRVDVQCSFFKRLYNVPVYVFHCIPSSHFNHLVAGSCEPADEVVSEQTTHVIFSEAVFLQEKEKNNEVVCAPLQIYSAKRALYSCGILDYVIKATGQTIQGSILDKISSFLLFSEPLDKK